MIIFIPFFLNILLLIITFPENGNTYFGFYNSSQYTSDLTGSNVVISTFGKGLPLLGLYISNSIIYNALYVLFLSMFSGLMSAFALTCSYWIKRFKVFVFLPVFLLFFITKTINEFSFNSSKYLNTNLLDYVTVNSSAGKFPPFFFLFCFVMLFFVIFMTWRKSRNEEY